ncbi:CBU_0592 family membrane protein [Sphingomonas sp.]|uniref:CBU_0592 family membrane protein n=1 Tax=Sphingomonas sp. TaxID=28214 RepID=UPI003AFF74AB
MASFTLLDAIGMVGVLLMLAAYALTVSGRIDPLRPAALLCNLVGAVAVLVSLTGAFNWSAVVIESAWAVIAAAGLVRWVVRRR